MVNAFLCSLHSYGQCILMVNSVWWPMHFYGQCILMVNAFLCSMHSYGQCILMVNAFLWSMHSCGQCIIMVNSVWWPMHILKTIQSMKFSRRVCTMHLQPPPPFRTSPHCLKVYYHLSPFPLYAPSLMHPPPPPPPTDLNCLTTAIVPGLSATSTMHC